MAAAAVQVQGSGTGLGPVLGTVQPTGLTPTHICVGALTRAQRVWQHIYMCCGWWPQATPLPCPCTPEDAAATLMVLHHAAVLLLFGPASKLPS